MRRRRFLASVPLTAAALGTTSRASAASQQAKKEPVAHSPEVTRYLDRIYDAGLREFACRATDAASHEEWRDRARPVLRQLLGLDRMQEELRDWTPAFELEEPEEMDGYTRTKGVMLSEPDVPVPFYVLRPQGEGPFPLALTPHGHGPLGQYVNLYNTPAERDKIAREDRDVAVQAVRRGYVAIAPATRGLGCPGVPDINKRHGDRDCRSQMIHCVLAGRTPMGERVWDMSRLVDWGLALPGVTAERVLITGNSGGGVVTLFTAACDTRITVAASCCAFSSFIRKDGTVQLCDCNLVPDILRFGDAHDIAGLIAPRWFLAVHGANDKLFYLDDIERTAERTGAVFAAAGVSERFDLRVGPEGHRFYKDLMWPFIDDASV
jgi:dienelactone hydrolase